MSLIVYPADGYDSLVSLEDAKAIVSGYSVKSSEWNDISTDEKERYLRISTDRVLDVIDTSLMTTDITPHCIKKAVSLIAVKDLTYGISSSVNANTGLITKEKIGDLEVTYTHGNPNRRISGRDVNPFPSSVISCLNSYGADINSNVFLRAKLVRS